MPPRSGGTFLGLTTACTVYLPTNAETLPSFADLAATRAAVALWRTQKRLCRQSCTRRDRDSFFGWPCGLVSCPSRNGHADRKARLDAGHAKAADEISQRLGGRRYGVLLTPHRPLRFGPVTKAGSSLRGISRAE